MVDVSLSGGEALQRHLAKLAAGLKKASVSVGFLSGATYPDVTSVALVAAIQNFGAPAAGIPPRPFFSNMVKDNASEWGDGVAQALEASDNDSARALAIVGEGIKGQLQEAIIDGSYAPNSPVTNLLKQRFPTGGQTFADVLKARFDVAAGATAPAGKPLEQSGHMLNSVGYEVKS